MANPGRKLDLTLPAMMDNAEAGNFINTEHDYDAPRFEFQRADSVDAMMDGSDLDDSSSSVMNSFIDMSYNPGDRADPRLGPYYPDHTPESLLAASSTPYQHSFQYTVKNNTRSHAKTTPKTSDQDAFIDPKLLHDTATPEPAYEILPKVEEQQCSTPELACEICPKRFAQKALLRSVLVVHITLSFSR
jgi:hypothetical protein